MKITSGQNKNFDLLIITPICFKKSLSRLAEHKRKFNIDTTIVTLNEIYNSKYFLVNGRDEPEKIKHFIRSCCDKWDIKYVLLVGGDKQLPVRYIYNFEKYPVIPEIYEPPYISDLYYADLYDSEGNFSTWDSNNNGIYGEWIGETAEDKNIDLKPDVRIGRLPCKNRLEVKIMVDKIINYERNTFGKSWFKNIVAVGGNTHPEISSFPDGEADLSEALQHVEDFNHVKLFSSKNNLNRTNIIKSVNKGCGFFVLRGHGSPPFWTTHKPGEMKWLPKFSIYHMSLLINRNKLPICIASGCRNSAFDMHQINLLKHPSLSYYWMDCIRNCWMWAITQKFTGGAIASIGASGVGYAKYEPITGGKADAWSFLIPQFFNEYKIDKTALLGDVWQRLILKYLKKYPIDWNTPSLCYKSDMPKPDVINARTVQQFILFGDPTLKIGGYNI